MIPARLATLTAYDVFPDGEVPTTPARPYFVFTPGSGRPERRPITGAASREAVRDLVMCVNNNPQGCVDMARKVVGLFEGWRVTPDQRVRTFVALAQPIADPDETEGYRWSLNVELNYFTRRNHDH